MHAALTNEPQHIDIFKAEKTTYSWFYGTHVWETYLKFLILMNVLYLKFEETSFIDVKFMTLQTSWDIFTARHDQ